MVDSQKESAGQEQEQQTITELRFSELTGISREAIRAQRRHVDPEAWCRRGNTVVWSADGARKLLAELGMDPAELDRELGLLENNVDAREVRVAKLGRNPRMLFCVDGAGREVLVPVRDARLFTIGMVIPVELMEGGRRGRLLCRAPRVKGRLGRRLPL